MALDPRQFPTLSSELLVLKSELVQADRRGRMESKAKLGRLDLMARRARPAPQVRQDRRVSKVFRELRGSRDLKVYLE